MSVAVCGKLQPLHGLTVILGMVYEWVLPIESIDHWYIKIGYTPRFWQIQQHTLKATMATMTPLMVEYAKTC